MARECVFCGAAIDEMSSTCRACGGRRVDDTDETTDVVKPGPRTCLRCGVPLVEGGLSPAAVQLTGSVLLVRWYRGLVRKARFWADAQSAEGRSGLPIRALRCEQCGALELVAENIPE